MHPNAPAPGDAALIDSSRCDNFDRQAYTHWLQRLREVCTERGIVFILDEVFVGFRLAPGGAQEYFQVRADMVTYGKTLRGGLPVGVICGRKGLMKRYHDDRPLDVRFARGTFNAHPYVMGAMHEFLERIGTPEVRSLYADLDATWNARAAELNQRLEAKDIPVRVANMSTIWTVLYTRPSRYNWMLDRYRPPDIQLELYRRRFRGSRTRVRCRERGHDALWLVLAIQCRRAEALDQAPDPERATLSCSITANWLEALLSRLIRAPPQPSGN
jgi:glutamate-1-semialdehyde 2,1-aminomutase